MIRGREGGLGARTRMPIGQLADLLQPQAGGVTQQGTGQDADEGAEVHEASPVRDSSHEPEYARRSANFLWVAHRPATYQLAITRFP